MWVRIVRIKKKKNNAKHTIAQSDPPPQVFSRRLPEIDILQHDVYTFDKIQISLPIHSEETYQINRAAQSSWQNI